VGKESTVWCKSSHRIKMTEKINREAKERHATEMAAYEARKFKFEFIPGRDKPQENRKQSMRN
jgi:hypothetical protein